MEKLILFVIVLVVLNGLVASIEDKAKTCRCDSYNGESRAPWTVSIRPISDYTFPPTLSPMNGLILNEKWVLATWEVNCFSFEVARPSVGLRVKIDGHFGYTQNELKSVHRMMLKDMGESKNETRYEFFLLELATSFDFAGQNNSIPTFQPGCFLQETRKATEFLYDNLSTNGLIRDISLISFRGEFTFADVSNNRSECSKEPEKLICLKYLAGPNTTEWYETHHLSIRIYLNTPLYHQVDGKRLIVATLARDEDDDFPIVPAFFRFAVYQARWFPVRSEHPRYVSDCGSKSRDLETMTESLSFFRISSFLDRIQEHVGDDLCLFERKLDDSVGLVPFKHTVDRLPRSPAI